MVDGWGAGFLGPYGNTWLETPALNHWATQSKLFERCIVPSLSLPDFYRSCFSGVLPGAAETSFNLAKILGDNQIPLHLLSDDAQVLPGVEDFGLASAEFLPEMEPMTVDSIETTQLARMMSVLLDWAEEPGGDEVVWAHSQGMLGSWDAPLEMRQALADEDDPDPPSWVIPPCMRSDKTFDPDEILGFTQAYSAQVVLLDMLLDELIGTIEELPIDQQPLVILTSSGGFPLGLHGQIGRDENTATRLFSDTVQVPLLIRQPGGKDGMLREQGLVQSHDISATLLNWFGVDQNLLPTTAGSGQGLLNAAEQPPRDRAYCSFEQQRQLITPVWSASLELPAEVQSTPSIDSPDQNIACELFVKPDDRWEMNNVASRCQAIVDGMTQAAVELEHAIQSGATQLPPLAEELLAPLG